MQTNSKKLKTLLKERKLYYKDAAVLLGCHHTTINNLVADSPKISIKMAKKIEEVFGLAWQDWF